MIICIIDQQFRGCYYGYRILHPHNCAKTSGKEDANAYLLNTRFIASYHISMKTSVIDVIQIYQDFLNLYQEIKSILDRHSSPSRQPSKMPMI